MTPTYVKAHNWSLTPLSPAPRSEPRDRAELRTVDDKTKAHLLIFSAQKSSLRVTTPTLCLLGRAGIWDETPQCQFDDLADAVRMNGRHRTDLGTKAKPSAVATWRLCC